MYFSDNISNNYSKADKENNKMKKISLLIIFLTFFFFSGCLNFPNIINTFFLDYDFVNIKNKNVIHTGLAKPYSQTIIIDDVNFSLGLFRDYERKGEFYTPSFSIDTYPASKQKNKLIESVLVNNVVVYDGKTKYSMLERMNEVSLIGTSYYKLNEEEIAHVQRTGLIDHVIKTDREGAVINANAEMIWVDFNSLPIKHKKVKILYDISIKCTTGETITINRELTGYLKLKTVHRHWEELFWYPSV
jgi:hypothetical protein